MELRQLRYFVAVAEELNFTRAAEKLHLAQPSLTRQIHNLEDELGVRLLDRTKNRVSLTKEGVSFLANAQRLVALSQESISAIQRFGRGESGQLNLGRSKQNLNRLPATLTTFYQNCPGVAINLFEMNPAEQLLAIATRKIDLGFIGLKPQTLSDELADLAWECVAHHNIVVVLPAFHPLVKKKEIHLSNLKLLFFVTLSEETHPGSRQWLSNLCQEAGFTPRILQDVEMESGIMTFVAEGLGVTLAREQIKNLPHPGVVFRPLAAAAKADYWIACHRENRSKALSEYIEITKKEAPAWR